MTIIRRNRETANDRHEALRHLSEGDSVRFTYERTAGNLSEEVGEVTRVWSTDGGGKFPQVYVGEYVLECDTVRRKDSRNKVGRLYEVNPIDGGNKDGD